MISPMNNKWMVFSLTIAGFTNSIQARQPTVDFRRVIPTHITPTGIPSAEGVQILISAVVEAARGCALSHEQLGDFDEAAEIEKDAARIRELSTRMENLGRGYQRCEQIRSMFRRNTQKSAIGLRTIGVDGKQAEASLLRECQNQQEYLDSFTRHPIAIFNPTRSSCGSFVRSSTGLCSARGPSSVLPVVDSKERLTLAAVCPTFHRSDSEPLAGRQFSYVIVDSLGKPKEVIGTESQSSNDLASQATHGNFGSCGQIKAQACRDLEELVEVENRLDTAALFHTSSSLVTTNREDCERLRQLLANPDKQPSSVAREGLRARGIDCRAGSFQPMDSI